MSLQPILRLERHRGEIRPWRKLGSGLLWILITLEMLGMGVAGLSKFQGTGWQTMFANWGYPSDFWWVIGSTEMLGALLLLVPRFASWAALLLVVVMLGALWTVTMIASQQLGPGIPLVHLVVLLIIAKARWGRRWTPAPRT